MITGMVAGLSEKLKNDPSDKEGWKRLIRSYGVLGKPREMADALAAAKSANSADTKFVAEVEAIAAQFARGTNQ
jgi:cytochrome c-type biogenesis protein CcmH